MSDTEQPEALRIADALDNKLVYGLRGQEAAACLRRQHAEIEALRAELAAAVTAERERCAKVCEALRDAHVASTKLASDPSAWCSDAGPDCEFVTAWNDAAAAIRSQPQRDSLG